MREMDRKKIQLPFIHFEKRKIKMEVNMLEQGIRFNGNYGYVRTAKYLYQSGVKWGVIQRVIDGYLLRKST